MDPHPSLAALVEAVKERDAAQVAAILSREPSLARAQIASEYGHTHSLLHRTIPGDGDPLTDEDMAIVHALVDAGAEVNAPGWGANNGFCTPITMAAWGGHAPVIRLLVSRGANPNGSAEQVARGHRPIDTAAHHGHTEAVEALVDAGAAHSLDHLLMVGARSWVEQALAADPGAASRPLKGGMPPLHLALTSRRGAELLDLLLEHGADLQARDPLGRTALQVAIEQQLPDAALRLVEQGAPIDLFAAAGLGDSERVARLLARDPTRAQIAQADGTTPLFYAAWTGDLRSTRLLLDAGAVVSPQSKRLWACLTPLHAALQQRHRDVTALLLLRGADPNACRAEPGQYWPTPLHVAARWGTHDDIVLLLDHGADPNGGSPVTESMDTGVLAWAVGAGDVALVRLLLDRGLDPRLPRHQEALQRARERGNAEVVRLLRRDGDEPNARGALGPRPPKRN